MATVVVLRAGHQRDLAFKTIFQRGDRLVLVDEPSHHPYFAIADDSILCDPENATAVVSALNACTNRIDAVITFSERVVEAAAAVSEALGLVGNSPDTAYRSRNKLEMRKALRQGGCATPRFAAVHDLPSAYAAIDVIGYPVVLKPLNSGGSTGVVRVDALSELAWSLEHAKRGSLGPSSRPIVLVEEYLEGPEFYVNAAFQHGACVAAFVSDRVPDRSGSFFVEQGSNIPSAAAPSTQRELIAVAEQGAASLGIRDGLAHVEIRCTDKGPVIIEIGARAGGGLQMDSVFLAYDVNLYDVAVDIALGRTPRVEAAQSPRGVAVRFLASERPGTLAGISGIDAAIRSNGGLRDLQIYSPLGIRIDAADSNTGRVGHLLAVADTVASASEQADRAIRLLAIEVNHDA